MYHFENLENLKFLNNFDNLDYIKKVQYKESIGGLSHVEGRDGW